jgi:hypothetical protein
MNDNFLCKMSGLTFDTDSPEDLDYYFTLYQDNENDTGPQNPQVILAEHILLNTASKQVNKPL